MDMDVYVGPLSRYHAGDWETVIERTAGETGAYLLEPSVDGRPSQALIDAAQESVASWLGRVNEGLVANGGEPSDWDDAPSRTYATVQAGVRNYGALIAWGAYARYAFDRPYAVPGDLNADPAVQAAMTTAIPPRLFTQLNCQMWLPGDFDVSVAARAANGQPVAICSTGALRRALNDFNQATWRASPETVVAWGERGPPLAGRLVEVEPGRFAPAPLPPLDPFVESPFEHAAQYAYSVMAQAVTFAWDNDLPIVLHAY